MADPELSPQTRNLIFDHIDSVELLDTLLIFATHPNENFDANFVTRELRSNINSIRQRIDLLLKLGLIRLQDGSKTNYVYSPDSSELDQVVQELASAYKLHHSRLVEMIFSPLKRARDLADAFRLSDRKKKT